MKEAARFLETLGAILELAAAEGLESGGVEALMAVARADVEALRLADPSARFELEEDRVLWRERPVAGAGGSAMVTRLREAGLSRLAPPDEQAAFGAWVAGLLRRLARPADPVPPAASPDPTADEPAPAAPTPPVASGAAPLEREEEEAWGLYRDAAETGRVPADEAESLATRLLGVKAGTYTAPVRTLDAFEELTPVHALNVALLSIGLGRHLAFDEEEVLAIALAALLHDVGRVRLVGAEHAITPDQRRTVIRQHPAIGARMLLDSGDRLAIPAVVAYEHHLGWRRAGGYPPLRYARSPHPFSRIVAICDAYDALRTERPYRAAVSREGAVEYLHVLGGKSLDPEIVTGFIGYSSEPHAWIEHPLTRSPERLAALRWLPESGYDPDLEPRPVQI